MSARRDSGFVDERKMTPEEMVARLLYRDGLMLVIDKPAGLPVHRGPKGGESLEDHFDALRFGLPRAPALAHRLDRDTSGCLVLGRHRKALAALGELFKHGQGRQDLLGGGRGRSRRGRGPHRLPLGRLDETRGWWMKPDPDGQPAVTTWKVMGRLRSAPHADPRLATRVPRASPPPLRGRVGEGGGASADSQQLTPLPQPSPASGGGSRPSSGEEPQVATDTRSSPGSRSSRVTGRTHQLRVHCAAMGWPIVGDTIYGTRRAQPARPAAAAAFARDRGAALQEPRADRA